MSTSKKPSEAVRVLRALVGEFGQAGALAVGERLTGHGGERKGAGRPKKPAKERSTARLAVRLRVDERKWLDAYLRREKISESTAVRRWIAGL